MNIEFYLKKDLINKIDNNLFYITGVIYDKNNFFKNNNIQKIGIKNKNISFLSTNNYSIEEKEIYNKEELETSYLEEFLYLKIWENINYEGMQIITRETTEDNIKIFIGILHIKNSENYFEDNSIYKINNGSIEFKEKYNKKVQLIEDVLLNRKWEIENLKININTTLKKEIYKMLIEYNMLKRKKKLTEEEKKIEEKFQTNPYYNRLLKEEEDEKEKKDIKTIELIKE